MAPVQAPETRFYRGSDRVVGGVCSGLAAGLHVDPLWIRLAFVLLALVQGIGIVVYAVLWYLMPERPEDAAARTDRLASMGADLGRAWSRLWAWLGGAAPAASPAAGTQAGADAQPTSTRLARPDRTLWIGGGLIVIGALLLAANSGLVRWDLLWPVVVIALGAFLLFRAVQRKP